MRGQHAVRQLFLSAAMHRARRLHRAAQSELRHVDRSLHCGMCRRKRLPGSGATELRRGRPLLPAVHGARRLHESRSTQLLTRPGGGRRRVVSRGVHLQHRLPQRLVSELPSRPGHLHAAVYYEHRLLAGRPQLRHRHRGVLRLLFPAQRLLTGRRAGMQSGQRRVPGRLPHDHVSVCAPVVQPDQRPLFAGMHREHRLPGRSPAKLRSGARHLLRPVHVQRRLHADRIPELRSDERRLRAAVQYAERLSGHRSTELRSKRRHLLRPMYLQRRLHADRIPELRSKHRCVRATVQHAERLSGHRSTELRSKRWHLLRAVHHQQ